MPGYIAASWSAQPAKVVSRAQPENSGSHRGEHAIVKGRCALCQEAVTDEQARAKLDDGSYHHLVDEHGRCIIERASKRPVFTPPISVKIEGSCTTCNRAVLNIQDKEETKDGTCRHPSDETGRCRTGIRHGVLQQMVLAASLPVKVKGVCLQCMGPVTNIQGREKLQEGWRHRQDSDGNCITACPLAPEQQRLLSCSNQVKMKGMCSCCSQAVMSEHLRVKGADGSWRHKQDADGQCIGVLHSKGLAPAPASEPASTPLYKLKQPQGMSTTAAPDTRSHILSLLQTSPSCVDSAACNFLHLPLSNPEVC